MGKYVGFIECINNIGSSDTTNNVLGVLINKSPTEIIKVKRIKISVPVFIGVNQNFLLLNALKLENHNGAKPWYNSNIVPVNALGNMPENVILGHSGPYVYGPDYYLFRKSIFTFSGVTMNQDLQQNLSAYNEYSIIYDNIDSECQDITLRNNEGIVILSQTSYQGTCRINIFIEFEI